MDNQETKLPEGEADLAERLEGFNKELLPLLGKYELSLGAQPLITPDGLTVARPVMFSARKKAEVPAEATRLVKPE